MPKALSEADKLKNEKSLILLLYTIDSQGRPSQNVTKIHQNPLSELTFFETKNRLENLEVLASKMTSKTMSKNRRWLTRNPPGAPPGTPWEPSRDPGRKINDSDVDFGAYFGPRAWNLKPNCLKINAQGVPEGHIQAIL